MIPPVTDFTQQDADADDKVRRSVRRTTWVVQWAYAYTAILLVVFIWREDVWGLVAGGFLALAAAVADYYSRQLHARYLADITEARAKRDVAVKIVTQFEGVLVEVEETPDGFMRRH